MGRAHKRNGGSEALTDRDISWLAFNRRVQDEADDPENPLLERAKFLAIVTSNLDEFIQVRYVGACEAADARDDRRVKNAAVKLYQGINRELLRQNNRQYQLYEGILGELYIQGAQLYPIFAMDETMSRHEREIFETELRPYLRPVPLEDAVPAQKQLHICVKLTRPRKQRARFCVLPIPSTLKRLYDLSADKGPRRIILLEDIVKRHLKRLFPKEEIEHAAVFRILRNQDFPVSEETREDIVPAVRDMLEKRRAGRVMRLEAEERMSEEMLTLLMKRFDLPRERRYRVTGPLDLNKLMMGLYGLLKRADLKYSPAEPVVIDELMGDDAFHKIDERDYLLYHPYHSFAPVVHLMRLAAADPTVRCIKQTLYRVSANSPIVAALSEAAQNGKQVTVLFEAHARFDEENNLYWGERLERAGCKVLYGLPCMKVHSKATLFVREENGVTLREAHLGTGNYHDGTAKLYTDFGLLTADKTLTADVDAFFTTLEGGEAEPPAELITAPEHMRPKLIELIARERDNALNGRPARIVAKMNSLSEETVIAALLEAGAAGARVELIVRGVCRLLPGLLGASDNIRVYSIVGRHLEHARAFWFLNGGEDEVYLSSADWMPRNLLKRVELMFPVKAPELNAAVRNVLLLQLADNVKRRVCDSHGVYTHVRGGGARLCAQDALIADISGVMSGEAPRMPATVEEGKI